MHTELAADPRFKAGDFKAAFETVFLKVDKDFLSNDDEAGTTAVTVLLTPDGRIYCANAGDSRCVMSRGGKAVPLSFDHKPMGEVEFQRIQAAGSTVTFDRVAGELAVARAIGDVRFKNNPRIPLKDQAVTAFPEVTEHQLTPDTEFVLLACDGVWDVFSNESAVEFIHAKLRQTRDVRVVTDALLDQALELGSKDNITALLIVFKTFMSQLSVSAPPAAEGQVASADAATPVLSTEAKAAADAAQFNSLD